MAVDRARSRPGDSRNANLQPARADAAPIIARGLSEGGIPAADRAYLTQLVAARTRLSQSDAAKRVDDVDAQVKADWTKTHQAADKARKAASYITCRSLPPFRCS